MTQSVFLYESITGGGTLGWPGIPVDTLLIEGAVMAAALTEDFARISGVHVLRLQDSRPGFRRFPASGPHKSGPHNPRHAVHTTEVATPLAHDRAVRQLASYADMSIVIAPELNGELLRVARLVTEAGGLLLGPSLETIAWASHKQATVERLRGAGIPCPEGILVSIGETWPDESRIPDFPIVVKRNDGAGSCGIRIARDRDALAHRLPSKTELRLEHQCEGTPMSVAVLPGAREPLLLQPCLQRLDPNFAYLGGQVIEDGWLASRARRLARRVASQLGDSTGYLGVDMIIGSAAEGSNDVVIDVNPRLTTSYVGLRAATETNLAKAMLLRHSGEEVSATFSDLPVAFDVNGVIHRGSM